MRKSSDGTIFDFWGQARFATEARGTRESPLFALKRKIAAATFAAIFSSLVALKSAQAAGDRSDAGIDADDARTGALLGEFGPPRPDVRHHGNRATSKASRNRRSPRPYREAKPQAPHS
jgi:hypothetical protein